VSLAASAREPRGLGAARASGGRYQDRLQQVAVDLARGQAHDVDLHRPRAVVLISILGEIKVTP
jgi:hypothetical protein